MNMPQKRSPKVVLPSKGNCSKSGVGKKLHKLVQEISKYSSIHGLGWYERTTNPYAKSLLLCVYVTILFLLPTIIGLELRDLLVNPEIGTSISQHLARNETYPIITVCHPGFFDIEKLAGIFY